MRQGGRVTNAMWRAGSVAGMNYQTGILVCHVNSFMDD
jgi:hypothetical protein